MFTALYLLEHCYLCCSIISQTFGTSQGFSFCLSPAWVCGVYLNSCFNGAVTILIGQRVGPKEITRTIIVIQTLNSHLAVDAALDDSQVIILIPLYRSLLFLGLWMDWHFLRLKIKDF